MWTHVLPKLRIYLAWALIVGSAVGWPLSSLWFARKEPQFVLGLSWLAILLTAVDILQTTSVREEVDDASPQS